MTKFSGNLTPQVIVLSQSETAEQWLQVVNQYSFSKALVFKALCSYLKPANGDMSQVGPAVEASLKAEHRQAGNQVNESTINAQTFSLTFRAQAIITVLADKRFSIFLRDHDKTGIDAMMEFCGNQDMIRIKGDPGFDADTVFAVVEAAILQPSFN